MVVGLNSRGPFDAEYQVSAEFSQLSRGTLADRCRLCRASFVSSSSKLVQFSRTRVDRLIVASSARVRNVKRPQSPSTSATSRRGEISQLHLDDAVLIACAFRSAAGQARPSAITVLLQRKPRASNSSHPHPRSAGLNISTSRARLKSVSLLKVRSTISSRSNPRTVRGSLFSILQARTSSDWHDSSTCSW